MAYASSFSSFQASQNGVWSWKDSYRWVDFDAAASAQIDERITHFWSDTKERSFSFPLTAGAWFNQSKNKDMYTCYVELNFQRSKISKIYQKNRNTTYQREMRRNPAFQLPSGNTKKLAQLFDKNYADRDEKDIMSEAGTLKFYKDLGINPESHNTLIVSYILKTEEMGIISRDEFVSGFVKQGCCDKSDIKQCVKNKCQQINGNTKKWKEFYRWMFLFVREDEKKKTIPTELAIQLWAILFQKDKQAMALSSQWFDYCEAQKDKGLKAVSRDLWDQIYDFLKETQSIDNYDDAGGSWPVAVDEFVEYLQEQKK